MAETPRAPGGPAHVGAAGPAGHVGRAGRPVPAGTPGVAGATGPTATTGLPNTVMTSSAGAGGNESIGIPARGAGGSGAPGAGGLEGQGGQNGSGGSGAQAADRVGIRGRGVAGSYAALTPQQSTYDTVYGAQAEQERREAQQRRSEARGSYTESWRANRAAIENYTPQVRVGAQTSLRTAQSPFAGYLTGMHRRIHRLFADGFLADLENLPSNNPLNDRSLVTTLEIILDGTGRIQRLGVVRTSGNMAFDVASLNAVRRSAPFGSVPQPILSGDGRVYMHWAFYRNERQCGTFNAEPYIMPNPGSPTPGRPAPSSPAGGLRDDRGDATPGGAPSRTVASAP
jgi:hypothetical protein